MLEDSISCSPGNDKKGSRSRRFHKKTKRKSQRLSGAAICNTFAEDLPCLEAMYEEPVSSVVPSTTQYEHFNPFEDEIILAAADMYQASTSSSKLNQYVSQGFVRLEKLPVIDSEEDSISSLKPSVSISNVTAPTVLGPETQFGITESEFGRFCDEAEIEVESLSQPTTETKTPKASKSIVDVILHDFCGSPCSESPPKCTSVDSTPIFLFRSKPIRTYSGYRQTKRRRNIVTELANIQLPEDDGNASDSSGLSVQEDLSQAVVPQLDTVDLNNSIRVCENLLNLSSYFSQLNTPPSSSEKEKIPASAILEQIMELRRKTPKIIRRRSVEEFYGFSDNDSDSKEDTLKEFLEGEDDVVQQINCGSLCHEKVIPKTSFTYDSSAIETVLEDANAVIEEAKKLISPIYCLNTKEDSTINDPPNCDKNEDIARNPSLNSPQHDRELFDDLWNDNEVLLNYATQKNFNLGKPANKRSPIGGNCLNEVSKKAEVYRKELLRDCKGAMKVWSGVAETALNVKTSEIATTNSLEGIATASRKAITKFSEAAEKRVGEDFEFDDARSIQENFSTSRQVAIGEVKDTIDVQRQDAKNPVGCSSTATFLGFSTASRKPIAISDQAKQRADGILKKFEQEEREKQIAVTDDMKSEVPSISKSATDPSFAGKSTHNSSGPTFIGFSTASRKPIAISDQAKQRADGILMKFEQEEREKRMLGSDMALEETKRKCNLSDATPNPTSTVPALGFAGFSTASRKPIAISVEAKRKADVILKKFEQTEKDEIIQETKKLATVNGQLRKPKEVKEEVKQKTQELLRDIEFFEEVFEEELITLDEQSPADIQTSVVNCIQNVMPECQPIFEGFKTASKKSIQISEVAKRHADLLLRKVENEDLPPDFLKCIEADLVNAGSSIKGIDQVDGASEKPVNHIQMTSKTRDEYLCVNGARLSKLNSAKKPFDREIHEARRQDRKELNDYDQVDPALARVDEIHEITRSFSQEYEITDKHVNLKRKRTDPRRSPDLISPRRLSYSDRSPLNCIENAVLQKTSSMPLIKSTAKSALISRKNLLSLSKRKRIHSPSRVGDTTTGPKTPEKVRPPLHCNANTTPNLKEFFNSVSTSTPRLIRFDRNKGGEDVRKDSSIDTDFRHINWEDANNSARLCKTNLCVDSNVLCSEVSPSPQQRIERLKMYGEPPPISPILMVNKCRPSGLRRGRSLMKP